MSHSDLISPKSYAIGVLWEYSNFLMQRKDDKELKEISNRVNKAVHILDDIFLDEITFNNILEEKKIQLIHANSIVESQKKVIDSLKKQIEILKSNIK